MSARLPRWKSNLTLEDTRATVAKEARVAIDTVTSNTARAMAVLPNIKRKELEETTGETTEEMTEETIENLKVKTNTTQTVSLELQVARVDISKDLIPSPPQLDLSLLVQCPLELPLSKSKTKSLKLS